MSSGSRNPNCGSCCILFMGISGKVGLFASLAGTVLAKAKERSDALHAIPQLQGPPYPAHFLQSPNITQWSCLAGILWSFVGPVIASVFWCSGKKDTGLAICFGGDFLPALALVVALIWEAESLPANCKHAADWEYNPTPTIFTLLVGSSNGTAAAKCNGFKSDRKTTIGLTVIWGVLGIPCLVACLVCLFYLIVKPVQVGMGLTGFVKDGLTTSRDIRHREKLIMERPYRRPMSMQMKTFRTVTELSPPDEALMEQGNPKLIRIFSLQSPNRSTPLMAQYLHFSDIVALAGTSKTLRYMLNRDLSLQEIRRYTCVSGTKRECWVCSAQICLSCSTMLLLPDPITTQHLDHCVCLCKLCYLWRSCRMFMWLMASAGRRGNLLGCDCAARKAPVSEGRLICSNCAILGTDGVLARRARKEAWEIQQMDQTAIFCYKCRKALLGSGAKCWICSECKNNCYSSLHSSTQKAT